MSTKAGKSKTGAKTSGGKSKAKTAKSRGAGGDKASAKKRKRTIKTGGFDNYITKVNKDVNKDSNVSLSANEASMQLNLFIKEFCAAVAPYVSAALRARGKNTLTHYDVLAGVLAYLPDKLGMEVASAGMDAVNAYLSSKEDHQAGEAKQSRASQAGLNISVNRVARAFLPFIGSNKTTGKNTKLRKGKSGIIFLAGAIEALLRHILEDGAAIAAQDGKSRLKANTILRAIREDADLDEFTRKWTIQGGVVPGVDERVLAHKQKAAKRKTKKA